MPEGLTGFPLVLPLQLALGLAGGAVLLGMLAAMVTTRLARRVSPAEAMRAKE